MDDTYLDVLSEEDKIIAQRFIIEAMHSVMRAEDRAKIKDTLTNLARPFVLKIKDERQQELFAGALDDFIDEAS